MAAIHVAGVRGDPCGAVCWTVQLINLIPNKFVTIATCFLIVKNFTLAVSYRGGGWGLFETFRKTVLIFVANSRIKFVLSPKPKFQYPQILLVLKINYSIKNTNFQPFSTKNIQGLEL